MREQEADFSTLFFDGCWRETYRQTNEKTDLISTRRLSVQRPVHGTLAQLFLLGSAESHCGSRQSAVPLMMPVGRVACWLAGWLAGRQTGCKMDPRTHPSLAWNALEEKSTRRLTHPFAIQVLSIVQLKSCSSKARLRLRRVREWTFEPGGLGVEKK